MEVDWELEDFEWSGNVNLSVVGLVCWACGLVLDAEEIEWGIPDLDVPSSISPYDYSEPPSLDDVEGLTPEDVHPSPLR